jgi:ATP-dependent RNA helicase DDX42
VLQARRKGRLNAAFVAGAGYGSDDEGVYRAAAAVDAATGAEGGGYDSDDVADGAAARSRDIESLAALQHEGITYAPFNKDFYEEAADVAAMSHAEVGGGQGRRRGGLKACTLLRRQQQGGGREPLCIEGT